MAELVSELISILQPTRVGRTVQEDNAVIIIEPSAHWGVVLSYDMNRLITHRIALRERLRDEVKGSEEERLVLKVELIGIEL